MSNQTLAVSIDELDTQEKHQQVRDAFEKLGGLLLSWLGRWEERNYFNYTYLVKELDGDILWWTDRNIDDCPSVKILTFQELLDLAYPKVVSKTTAVTKEAIVSKETSWYDYDKQVAVAFPPVGEWVFVFEGKGYIVGRDSDEYVVVEFPERDQGMYEGHSTYDNFKPLDFDKNDKVKKERQELLDVIVSAGAVSDGTLADIILASGYKREA